MNLAVNILYAFVVIICSVSVPAMIGALVVWGCFILQSNNGSKPAPANYDNRWPGYPLRPEDEGFDPTMIDGEQVTNNPDRLSRFVDYYKTLKKSSS